MNKTNSDKKNLPNNDWFWRPPILRVRSGKLQFMEFFHKTKELYQSRYSQSVRCIEVYLYVNNIPCTLDVIEYDVDGK